MITHIKKLKGEKILQEEIQEKFHQKEVDLHNEFNKNLLEKIRILLLKEIESRVDWTNKKMRSQKNP